VAWEDASDLPLILKWPAVVVLENFWKHSNEVPHFFANPETIDASKR
jgi:hypothetical protein